MHVLGKIRSVVGFLWRSTLGSRGVLLILVVGSLAAVITALTVPSLDPRLFVVWGLFLLCAVLLRILPAMQANVHVLQAHLGLKTDRAPDIYVKALFDDYAETYDRHLLIELEYKVPNHLRGLLDDSAERRLDVLDIGCGTGLAGPLFRPLAKRFVGVDLSKEMIKRAEAKRCYDALYTADALTFLDQHRDQFDLIIAADVLCYMGALLHPFAHVRRALREGGRFAFSTEQSDADGWTLDHTGRYVHAPTYVSETLAQAGLTLLQSKPVTLRLQDSRPVQGNVWLTQKL